MSSILRAAVFASLCCLGLSGCLAAAAGAGAGAGFVAADNANAAVPSGADLIVAVNGRPVTDMADVSEAVASRKVGDTITVTVLRDGKSQTATLTLKDRPADIGVK